MTKIRDYTVIDHIGSIENVSEVYKKAYALSNYTAWTLKQICLKKNPNVGNINGMKNAMRQTLNPTQVIIIINDFNTVISWIIEKWAERCNDITIIEADYMAIYSLKDVDPTLFQTWEVEATKARRCASIWAKALDYTFSAPLFDTPSADSLADMYTKRQNQTVEFGSYACKRTTRPEKYRATKALAPEEEVQKFFEYYKYLYTQGLLEEFISSNWSICPECGRPINENEHHCQWCDTENENFIEEFIQFYDTEEVNEAEA